MRLSNFVTGLEMIRKYFDNPDGFHTNAEHDIFCVDRTDKPIERATVETLVGLGWFQEGIGGPNGYTADDYDPQEPWAAFM